MHTRCVANNYAAPHERIVEFGHGTNGTGGLISLRPCPSTGKLIVEVYRGENVIVRVCGKDYTPSHGG